MKRNTSNNLCNKCRVINEEPFKKDKKILDYCIENNIINEKQKRVWDTFNCFVFKNEIRLYNYEQLSEILNELKQNTIILGQVFMFYVLLRHFSWEGSGVAAGEHRGACASSTNNFQKSKKIPYF